MTKQQFKFAIMNIHGLSESMADEWINQFWPIFAMIWDEGYLAEIDKNPYG